MKKLFLILIVISFSLVPIKAAAVSTSAKSAVLINADTGEIIYQQNAYEKLPMASTTKIMTALLLCENGNLDREITVSAEMLRVEGSSMGLLAGDRVTLHDLLYGMLLASGNDAANVTAYVLGGTVDGFVKMMNTRAEELGLKNTHFETPSGLDGENHYTTAYDLALLAAFAMENVTFCKAASAKSATLNYGNPPYKRTLTNHNKLLKSFEGAIGVKTGFTKKSGRCLVSAAERDGKRVIAVTLNDPNDWADHTSLLEYGLNAVKLIKISSPKSEYKLPVISGKQELEIYIEPLELTSLGNDSFSCEVLLPRFLYAPIKKGETVGYCIYKKGDTEIAQTEIKADYDIGVKEVSKSFFETAFENIKYIFMNLWVK